MKTKKLLFELIEINTTMYNILYTLLCVCVLLCVLVFSVGAINVLVERNKIPDFTNAYMVLVWLKIYFIGYKLMHKKHYA